MEITLPDVGYQGWGWGPSMTNTELVVFSAEGASSAVTTYYSTGDTMPTLKPSLQTCYTWNYRTLSSGEIHFTATRPLDCGIPNSYVVKLDTELTLITAYQSTTQAIAYHDNNRFSFPKTLGSDGTCTPAPAPGPESQDCLTSLSDGGSINVNYDPVGDLMVINATIPQNSYVGWGWGASMKNTEMVIFQASTTTTASTVTTYYSTSETTPGLQPDLQSCYSTTISSADNNMIQFITTRPLDCGVANNYVVKLDSELDLISAW